MSEVFVDMKCPRCGFENNPDGWDELAPGDNIECQGCGECWDLNPPVESATVIPSCSRCQKPALECKVCGRRLEVPDDIVCRQVLPWPYEHHHEHAECAKPATRPQ